MGIKIYRAKNKVVVLALTCDGSHGLLPGMSQTFNDPSGFVVQHSAAMRAGWLETYDKGGRIFLGPCCSGKKAK